MHADMDAFFAAIEQRDRPELRGRPVIVGGLSARGVVSTASYEARPFGVHSAMPMAEARARCPDAAFLCPDLARYRRESARIFEILHSFSPLVEGLSLDEAFLDLSGSERLHGPPAQIARSLRQRVERETGLRVSVGIAPVKSVAKIASDLAKPDGARIVEPDAVAAFLAPLPIRRIWGLGPEAESRLLTAGITTVGELRTRSEMELRALIGRAAAAVRRLAWGEDPRGVESGRAPKSCGEESTFERDVSESARIRAEILSHADAVGRRLRAAGLRARGLTLKIKLARPLGGGRYPLVTRSATLPRPTDDGQVLARAARDLWERSGICEPVRLLGVAATRLETASSGSLSLFPSEEEQRRTRLNRAVDAIQDRFGARAVGLGANTRRGRPRES